MEDRPDRMDDAWQQFIEGDQGEPEDRAPGFAIVKIVAGLLAMITVVGFVVLWPTGATRESSEERLNVLGIPSQFERARVVSVDEGPCSTAGAVRCSAVGFLLESGPDAGATFRQEFSPGGFTPEFDPGRQVVLSYRPPGGTVLGAIDVPCSFATDLVCRELTVLISRDPGTVMTYEVASEQPEAQLQAGDVVTVNLIEGQAGEVELLGVSIPTMATQYQFADFHRRPLLLAVVVAFAVAVVALGRWRGLAALAGLAVSLSVILVFVVPAILDGRSPVWVAVVGSSGIAFVALYLAHGFSRKTTVALLGMVGALVLTALLSAIVVALAGFSGLVSDDSGLLTFFPGIDVRGLLLAGVVLGAAGALDDVTVTQASAVWELKAANRELGSGELWRRGLRIGRDHIASTVNTLLLAYAGAALPLLVLFVLSSQSLGDIANSEVVAVEIVRTLVGSIGLVAAVPLTTWLAALIAGEEGRVGGRRPVA